MNPEGTNYPAMQFWFNIGQYVITVVIGVYVWISNRANARSKDVEKIACRVVRLESSSISHADLGKVYERINFISDQMHKVSGTVTGIKGSVDMIQECLLNKGDRE